MTLDIQTKEPQPVQYNSVDHTLSFELIENESVADDNDYVELTARVDGLQLPDLAFSNLTTNVAGSTVTANAGAGAFSAVRVGDTVAGNEIAVGSVVSAINGDSSELTLDQAPTSDVANASITVTPQVLNATLAKVRLKLSNVNNTDLQLEASLYTFDGKSNVSKRNDSSTDDLTVGDASTTNRTSRTVDASKFVDNLGIE